MAQFEPHSFIDHCPSLTSSRARPTRLEFLASLYLGSSLCRSNSSTDQNEVEKDIKVPQFETGGKQCTILHLILSLVSMMPTKPTDGVPCDDLVLLSVFRLQSS